MLPMTLRQPADLLAILPYLLGFHPEDSLVLVGVRRGAVAFQARTDLPAVPGSEAALAGHLLDVVARQDVDGVLLVGYGPAGRADPLVREVRRACAAHGLAVPGALRAHRGRYWSYGCADPRCCPRDGTPYDVSTSAVAAAATVAGCVALPDRAAFARQVEPLEGAPRAAAAATDRAAARLAGMLDATGDPSAALLAAGRAALAGALGRVGAGGVLSDDEVAWLSLLLAAAGQVGERAFRAIRRDAAAPPGRRVPARRPRAVRVRRPAARAAATVPGRPRLAAQRALWADVVRRCAPGLAATPAALLALAAWHGGDGVLASVAVERALRVDPGHRPARRLDALLRDGIPPPRPVARRPRGTGGRPATGGGGPPVSPP